MVSAQSAARACAQACRRAAQFHTIPRTSAVARACQQQTRGLRTTASRWAEGGDKEGSKKDGETTVDFKTLKAMYEDKTTPETLRQLDELAKVNGFNSVDEYAASQFADSAPGMSNVRGLNEELVRLDQGPKPVPNSLWFDEEFPDESTEEAEEFDEDDITSIAHSKLDEVREQRHYNRLAVWEMPLLAKFAKPFEPPTDAQVLRWRFTSYMGETHPAESKVVVEFSPEDLNLTEVQASKLKKLAGSRYNPETQLVKMSCENYEHQAQNQAYLTDLINDLIKAAKDPKDTFEDVPLDTRHKAKAKPKPRFPVEWRMTDERRAQLDGMRQREAIADAKKVEDGLLLNGTQKIESYLMLKAAEEQEKLREAEAVAATVPRGGRTATAARARR